MEVAFQTSLVNSSFLRLGWKAGRSDVSFNICVHLYSSVITILVAPRISETRTHTFSLELCHPPGLVLIP